MRWYVSRELLLMDARFCYCTDSLHLRSNAVNFKLKVFEKSHQSLPVPLHLNIPCTKPHASMGITAINQKIQTRPTARYIRAMFHQVT